MTVKQEVYVGKRLKEIIRNVCYTCACFVIVNDVRIEI